MKTLTHILGAHRRRLSRSVFTGAMAALIMLSPTNVAWATIDNSVTVNGLDPQGGAVSASDTESVDVEDAAPLLLISSAYSLTTDTDTDTLGDEDDIVTYTYTVTNSGNVSITGMGITVTDDGSGGVATPQFASFTTQAGSPAANVGDTTITLAPGGIAVFTATYTITQDDIFDQGGTGVGPVADSDIDQSAVASGDYVPVGGGSATHTSPTPATTEVPLDSTPSLQVAKVADDTTDVAARSGHHLHLYGDQQWCDADQHDHADRYPQGRRRRADAGFCQLHDKRWRWWGHQLLVQHRQHHRHSVSR